MAQPIKGIHFITIARSTSAITLATSSSSRGSGAGTTSSHISIHRAYPDPFWVYLLI